jgi:hypothetical protein
VTDFRLKDVSFYAFANGTLVVSDRAHACGSCGRAAYVFVCANGGSGSHCLGCSTPAEQYIPVLRRAVNA